MLEIGQTISHYRLVEKIYQLVMGEAYKFENTKLGSYVDKKFLTEAQYQNRPAPR